MVPGDRIDRIENLVGVGHPDVNMCLSGIELWVEIKAPIEPKRPGTPLFGSNHKLSQDQKNWLLAQRNAKGRAFIYIATQNRLLLIASKLADGLNEMTTPELIEHALWHNFLGARATPDWAALRKELLRGN
jgi:hypothetical protein